MKLGFFLRRKVICIENIIRRLSNLLDYFIWLLFSFYKFSPAKKKIKKVLVVDISALGDSLNTFCVIKKLKENYPVIDFYFLCGENCRGLEKYSDINVIFYKKDEKIITLLKEFNFDITIVIHSGLVNYKDLSSFENTIGSEIEGISDFCKKFFLKKRIFPFYSHKIRERFRIFELSGFKFKDYKLSLPYSPYHKKEAEALMKNLRISRKMKVIFLNPSAGTSLKARKEGKMPSHDWPLENFSKLADLLSEEPELKILITGTSEDKTLAEEIINKARNKKKIESICGKISFFGLGELMREFKDNGCLVSIDTGTVHLGTAVNIPVVDLMGPYDPKLYCAWNPSKSLEYSKAITIFHKEICSKCRKYYCPEKDNICMKAIDVNEVYELVKSMLK